MMIMNIHRFFKCIAIVAFTATMATTASAQSIMPTKADYKAAKKEAKNDKKKGWQVNPGNPPLEEQYARSYVFMRNQEDWITGEANPIGTIYDVVRSQALFEAKAELAKSVIKIAGNIKEDKGKDNLLSAISFEEHIKSIFANEIKYHQIITDCYRNLKDNTVEVRIKIAIKKEDAIASYENMKRLYEELMKK